MKISTVIVDTNVVLVANEQHSGMSPECAEICALILQNIMLEGRIVLDDGFLILREYQNKLNANRGKRPGSAFVKWALRNQYNATHCDQVRLTENHTRGFDSFPDDEELGSFDDPDRKFVAVSVAHPKYPPILQAADSKWLDWAAALERHGVDVKFVCKSDIQRFHKKKFGK